MGGIVVDDQMKVEIGRGLMIDQLEKMQELSVPMARHASPDNPAVQHVQRREQGGQTRRFAPICESSVSNGTLAKAPAGIHYSGHLDGDGATIFAHACKLGLEGIVSKHREHPYRSGPSKAWLKIKNPDALGVLRFKNDEP
jgi:hypothetical protein